MLQIAELMDKQLKGVGSYRSATGALKDIHHIPSFLPILPHIVLPLELLLLLFLCSPQPLTENISTARMNVHRPVCVRAQ